MNFDNISKVNYKSLSFLEGFSCLFLPQCITAWVKNVNNAWTSLPPPLGSLLHVCNESIRSEFKAKLIANIYRALIMGKENC